MGRKGTMTEKEINSQFLNEKKAVKIYRPESFSPFYEYNICIMQDGNDYFQMGRVATFSDRLHEEREIENTIFVGIHYKNRQDRRNKYHPSGVEHEAYVNFIVKEVLPVVEEEVPSTHMEKNWALMGDSLAGTFALVTALKHPDIFGKIIMHSPYIDDTVLCVVEQAKVDFSTLDIYHIIGEKENEAVLSDGKVEDLLTPNRKLHDLLSRTGANYFYEEIKDGNHTWKYWQKDMTRTLKTMFSY